MGPVGYKFPQVAGTKETMGGAGTERSEVESPGHLPSRGQEKGPTLSDQPSLSLEGEINDYRTVVGGVIEV